MSPARIGAALLVLIALGAALVVLVAPGAGLPFTGEPAPPSTVEVSAPDADPEEEARLAADRRVLVEEVERQGIEDPGVLEAIGSTPRHLFVPAELRSYAYLDRPLPIGYGQTISQPYIVALMTELLELEGDETVLEVGAGSGYQAAVLSPLVETVYTMEIIPELAEEARERLERLGYDNVMVRSGDGYYGWEEHAPFQAIIVTAAPDHVPQPLVSQLAEGGRMVIPVGQAGAYQTLWKIVERDGELVSSNHGAVAFVPLTGAH